MRGKKFKLSINYSPKTGVVARILFKTATKSKHFFYIPLAEVKSRFSVMKVGSKRVVFRKFFLVACILERCIKNGALT